MSAGATGRGGFNHWHLEMRVRIELGGGFEWGTGFFVNPLAPEEAARLVRNEIAAVQPTPSVK